MLVNLSVALACLEVFFDRMDSNLTTPYSVHNKSLLMA
jgi:hypothetical protein